MARARSSGQRLDTRSPDRRRATQRERLLAGIISAANRDGYAGASVSVVIGEAGVSRPTFYEYFEDRDACFLGALADVQQRLLAEARAAIAAAAPEDALTAAVGAMVAFAAASPGQAQFLMKEALAGGPPALAARDAGVGELAKLIEAALRRAPGDAPIPDVPLAAVIGAVQRLLAMRLRRGERLLAGVLEDLQDWLARYAKPACEHRWRVLRPLPQPARSPYLAPSALRPPPPLGPGRPRLSEEEVLEIHRQRIMFATALAVRERGYTAVTVAEITKLASVDGRAFYRNFKDKQEAFSAIHELGFQFLMAATATAFFAGQSWPERIWEAFRAAAQSIDETPAFAHVAFVEAYAVGPQAIQRVEDSRMAFTIFLQEGYGELADGVAPPPRLALEAIVATIFEIVYLRARSSAKPRVAGLLGHAVHMCLVPFTGSDAAEDFLELEGASRPSSRRAARSAPAS